MITQPPSVLRLCVVALHVLSLLFWIGSLVSMTRVLASADGEPDVVRTRLAATARKLYRVVASPWMGIAVLTGVVLLVTFPPTWQAQQMQLSGVHWLFKQGYFHAKLTGVLVMLGLHFTLGSRIRRAEREGAPAGQSNSMRMLQLGVLLTSAFVVACMYPWRRVSIAACPPMAPGIEIISR